MLRPHELANRHQSTPLLVDNDESRLLLRYHRLFSNPSEHSDIAKRRRKASCVKLELQSGAFDTDVVVIVSLHTRTTVNFEAEHSCRPVSVPSDVK
jgi:hypothetical protein